MLSFNPFVDYKKEVSIWFDKLMPRIQPYLYGNGGPIIMVQIENEYGMYSCDKEYKEWMRDEIAKYVGDKAVTFTNDYNSEDCMRCGSIENVLATIDFGPPGLCLKDALFPKSSMKTSISSTL